MSELWLPKATPSQPGQLETRTDRGLHSAQVRDSTCGLPFRKMFNAPLNFFFCCRYELYVKMVSNGLKEEEKATEQSEELVSDPSTVDTGKTK